MNKVMLIDGENCCTETLIKHLAFRKDWKVILILGANQNVSLQDYGVSIERCCITGHNAADFSNLLLCSIGQHRRSSKDCLDLKQ